MKSDSDRGRFLRRAGGGGGEPPRTAGASFTAMFAGDTLRSSGVVAASSLSGAPLAPPPPPLLGVVGTAPGEEKVSCELRRARAIRAMSSSRPPPPFDVAAEVRVGGGPSSSLLMTRPRFPCWQWRCSSRSSIPRAFSSSFREPDSISTARRKNDESSATWHCCCVLEKSRSSSSVCSVHSFLASSAPPPSFPRRRAGESRPFFSSFIGTTAAPTVTVAASKLPMPWFISPSKPRTKSLPLGRRSSSRRRKKRGGATVGSLSVEAAGEDKGPTLLSLEGTR
mmetsp:Transcript_17259/g.50139  ORF Transcript_17259/g.50139 Transcript_17259/m.50139 type:complete len:281 (+) Transcript_17259:770-1612(+)